MKKIFIIITCILLLVGCYSLSEKEVPKGSQKIKKVEDKRTSWNPTISDIRRFAETASGGQIIYQFNSRTKENLFIVTKNKKCIMINQISKNKNYIDSLKLCYSNKTESFVIKEL